MKPKNEVAERLTRDCLDLALRRNTFKSEYEKIIQLVSNSNCNDETKIVLLTQLYRYGYYNNVRTAIDPRVDHRFKYDTINSIEKAVLQNDFTDETINHIIESIDFMRAHIDNPVEFIKKEIDFYKRNGKVRF